MSNIDKFPAGYVIELTGKEWDSLKPKFSTSIKACKVKLPSAAQKSLMQKSGEIIAGILDDDLSVSDSETSIELNFAVLKFKHTIKKKKK